jgi:hypothetical protein
MTAAATLGFDSSQALLTNTLAAVKLGFHAGTVANLEATSQDETVIREWAAAGTLGGISTAHFGEGERLAVVTYRTRAGFIDGSSGELVPSGVKAFRELKAQGLFPRTLEIVNDPHCYLIYRSTRPLAPFNYGLKVFVFAVALIEPSWISGDRPIAQAPDWMMEGATEPAEAELRYKPIPLGELVSARPPPWQIRELLPAEGLAVVYGAPGSGKSFLVLDMLAAIARGESWGGQRTKQGVAVYVGLEALVNERVAAYLQHHSLTAADLAGKLHIFQRLPFNLANPKSAKQFISDLCLQGIEPNVVVIDTLARSLPGSDENSSADMGAAIACAGQISNAFGCLTVLVHHSGKDVDRGARGHSSLLGAADAELAVTYDKVTGIRQVRATKMKDGADGVGWQFRLSSVPLPAFSSADPDEGPRSSLVIDQITRSDGHTSGRGGRIEWTPARSMVRNAFVQALTAAPAAFDDKQECSHEQWASTFDTMSPLRDGLAAKELRSAKQARSLAFKRGVEWLLAEKLVVKDSKRPFYSVPDGR